MPHYPLFIFFLAYKFVAIDQQFGITQSQQAVTYINAGHDTYGFAAHDYLAGSSFYEIGVGDFVTVVFMDYSVEKYVITDISRYTASDGDSVFSRFTSESGDEFSSAMLYEKMYAPKRLVLQTCWNGTDGRIFLIGEVVQMKSRIAQ